MVERNDFRVSHKFALGTFLGLMALLSGLFVNVSIANAQNIYVSLNGDDKDPGTISRPLKTIQAAANAATPGTNIIIRAGRYTLAAPIKVSKSGTASAYISFAPYTGEHVTLDGSPQKRSPSTSEQTSLLSIASNYITVSGLEVANAPGNGIGTWCSSHTRILNNTVHDNYYDGIIANCDHIGASVDNIIKANVVYHNALQNSPQYTPGHWGQGIDIHFGDSSVETMNTVYENYGEGLGTYQSRGTIISNNVAWDNFSCELYVDGVSNAVITGNYTYTKNNPNFFRYNAPGNSIQLGIEKYNNGGNFPLNNTLIANNIFVGGRYGIYYGNYSLGGGMQNAVIANNTVVNSVSTNINLSPDKHANNKIVNNVFYQSPKHGLMIAQGSPAGFAFDYNNWFGGNMAQLAGNWIGKHDQVSKDPKMLNPLGYAYSGFESTTYSPVIGTGTTVNQVPVNFQGAGRINGKYNIGAY